MTASGGAYHVSYACPATLPANTFCFTESILGPHNSGAAQNKSILVSTSPVCKAFFTDTTGGAARGRGGGFGRDPPLGGSSPLWDALVFSTSKETRPPLIENSPGALAALFAGFIGVFLLAFAFMIAGSSYLWRALLGSSYQRM